MEGPPVVQEKVIYCVRHGKSVSNEWMERPGNHWGCPDYNDFRGNTPDAPLSEIGMAQARALPTAIPDVQLVVVSPLTRCLQTLLHSSLVAKKPDTPVIVLPIATERVYSLSEVGRFKSTLQQEFPLNWDWSNVPDEESWWYTTTTGSTYQEWRPHGNGQVYAVPGEPMTNFHQRMGVLRQWLLERPEQCILLVTHWGVIHHLSNGKEVANCQLERLELLLAYVPTRN